jgi:hypothetical protein
VGGWRNYGVSIRLNRLVLNVTTQRGEEEFFRKLTDTSVPPEAVVVEVSPQMTIEDQPPRTSMEPGIELKFRFLEIAEPGEPITFIVGLHNATAEVQRLEFNGNWPVSLVIFSEDGRQLWKRQASTLFVLGSVELEPGETHEFETEWDGLDDYRVPLDPGVHWVRAYYNPQYRGPYWLGLLSSYPRLLYITSP